jgi:hypothetical protein
MLGAKDLCSRFVSVSWKLNSGTPMEFELESGLLLEPENGICCPETYETGLMALYEFRQRFALPHIWPVPLVDLCNFVAYLFQAQLSHSSGISFFSKINDLEDMQ